MPISGGLVADGVVSRSARDTAAALDAVHGADAGALRGALPAGGFLAALDAKPRLRIGFNHQCLPDVSLSPEALTALGRRRACRTWGVDVLPVDLWSTGGPADSRDVYLAQVCARPPPMPELAA